ncbi:MAG: hypothetical protein IT578_04635, partial [Verrucomicrobiae bacterium]|nr:hypothetical protein [Verrucomicrobiae bacterium]
MRGSVQHDLFRDLMLCAASASLLFLGPLLDWALHPGSPLWLPWATMPDMGVYVAVFRRAAEGALLGDPFLWEHRIDPSSVFTVYAFWPSIFGRLIGAFGDGALPLAGWGLSTLWFFGLFRLAKALSQSPARAFATAGFACFFSVNLAYNLNGYHFRFGAWNLGLSEHLRVYPTAAAMAVYALAAWRLHAAVSAPSFWRIAAAGILVALSALGRPFDWMVLVTAGFLLTGALFLQRHPRSARAALAATLLGSALAAPAVFRLALHQSRHAAAFEDLMWRGIYHAKSLLHYGKYTLALIVVTALTILVFRNALGGRRLREWPLAAVFPVVMVLGSLLPYFHTLPRQVTVTGFAYFFVFSFSTWATIAAFQAWHLSADRRRPRADAPWMAIALLGLILAQQLSLGLGQRSRQAAHVVPRVLRDVYRGIREGTTADCVILATRPGTEVIAATGRWVFSPTPVVAALLSPTPTAELLERALWAEYLLGGDLDSLAPLFEREGMAEYLSWKARQEEGTRTAVEGLEKRIGYNSFVFHPDLNRWDLRARGLELPDSLKGQHDFVAW